MNAEQTTVKNKWVSFISRVAFICNLCFVPIIIAHFGGDFIPGGGIKSTIIVLGFVSFLVNLILQAGLLVLRATKKNIPVKAWLRIFNAVIFVVEIFFFFMMSGN